MGAEVAELKAIIEAGKDIISTSEEKLMAKSTENEELQSIIQA